MSNSPNSWPSSRIPDHEPSRWLLEIYDVSRIWAKLHQRSAIQVTDQDCGKIEETAHRFPPLRQPGSLQSGCYEGEAKVFSEIPRARPPASFRMA